MSDISLAVANKIQSAGVATLGTDLFTSPVRMVSAFTPQNCIFVYESDGFLPRPYMGQNKQFRRTFIDIRVRYERDKFASGDSLARDVYDALDLATLTLAEVNSTFIWCKPLRSAPSYISTDKDDFHEWSFNFEIGYERQH